MELVSVIPVESAMLLGQSAVQRWKNERNSLSHSTLFRVFLVLTQMALSRRLIRRVLLMSANCITLVHSSVDGSKLFMFQDIQQTNDYYYLLTFKCPDELGDYEEVVSFPGSIRYVCKHLR